jgi:hypothetical protein
MPDAGADLAIWTAAVNSALLGTDRAPLTVSATDGSLGAACRLLAGDGTDASATLLRVAAAARAYRRCGWTPPSAAKPLPAPCSPDDRPACSAAAASLLRRILQGEHPALLLSWLALARQHGVRAPADALPGLLDLARGDPPLRSLVRAAGGTRAVWLAGFNDDWSYARTVDDPDALAATWETGTGAARLGALQQLRCMDAERARVLVEASWAQESPTDRVGFVAALIEGLSSADEPFLERALDDKRKDVRQQAAAVLARLPSSALVARMIGRAKRFVSLGATAILRRARVDVALPETADAAMIRDGVNPKPPVGTAIGERAWWLAQIIAAVPPSTWTSAWPIDADTLVRAMDGHEWREPVVAGWLTATERFGDADWARALWDNEAVARIEPTWGAPSLEHVFVNVLPPEHVDAELRQAVAASPDALRGPSRVLIALLAWRSVWSDALARAIARRLREYAEPGRVAFAGEFGLRAVLDRCAHAVPVSAISAFLDGWPEQSDVWPAWASAVDALTSVLRFRHDLHLAFTEESSA